MMGDGEAKRLLSEIQNNIADRNWNMDLFLEMVQFKYELHEHYANMRGDSSPEYKKKLIVAKDTGYFVCHFDVIEVRFQFRGCSPYAHFEIKKDQLNENWKELIREEVLAYHNLEIQYKKDKELEKQNSDKKYRHQEYIKAQQIISKYREEFK